MTDPLDHHCPRKDAAEPQSVKSLRILLAEDTPANQKLVTRLLQQRGHAVEVVQNGREAVERARHDRFDALLMDVEMPLLDGLEATRAIRAEEPPGQHLHIVAMTAHADRDDALRCLAAGMDAYLTKPIDRRELIACVEQAPAGSPPVAGQCPATSAPQPERDTFDLALAMERFGGVRALFVEMANDFLQAAPQALSQVRAALESGDLAAVQHVTHRLKGTIDYFAVPAATAALRRTEQAATRNDLSAVRAELPSLERHLRRLCEALAVNR